MNRLVHKMIAVVCTEFSNSRAGIVIFTMNPLICSSKLNPENRSMMMRHRSRLLRSLLALIFLLFLSCSGEEEPVIPEPPVLSDEELLDLTQRETFRYF